ncbi:MULTISPECIES: ribosome biogenesis GTP-binding protein YihA/YsxC [Flectobacillus]|jgi:GTP-binding protein|uniref:Probable GTP-binding protein EngB n=1 Tax=Flectobacillus roseus TaxID=502259 RepID=A0ABT6YBU6_9BACT|nr:MULTISPECIES: ribosome biogenesis GTP-binding protein YihA/YsxC [Flectobacillus]MDI9861051.1 ribosome biogenesis GTP-binding protein YihA/YsxC [Flectobacillus roseus]MDI9870243.1 ribosome biogenesis GTP-binding protein YihA/YsxC [Flectobacillus roseus]NBA75846.1 YihA family ribosome biogenesis GTP-binding protein [Emticicia sp. ODNR4P]PAC32071.1 YihA family ribosome biogenesis GTP-binding protein [Flectobacillus sp. BAB-3569]
MKINQASFLMSNSTYQQCPKPDKPEYAFIGRSNVGKSSLINSIVRKKNLAKTSQTPGKTQLINHFFINEDWYLVDLPGYGYAKVSKVEREKFEKMINEYLTLRTNLVCTFVLIDVRHEPQKVDVEFMQKLGENGLPFCIVFTKADKLSNTAVNKNLAIYEQIMLETWEEMPQYFVTSSVNGTGREEILAYIDELNQGFKP